MPGDVVAGVRRYLDAAGLSVAGIDFGVQPCGDWVFLEANTVPQFGWLQTATGLDMAAAMADVLQRGRP